ncbi:Hly-III family protein [Cellulomonas flavigena DSM 20109]|uniref:Hly-III family protein n=1 Tax=Cellulomonas flavigena (strain ATCC 482 / DSM 20109 / BCRC 11376 / JCM 18109 / NBRC 3775 / NCIMB 8073 / NRS 134) TaxID=446466 RepID=D5UK87_CELFN|nr:hemolysin III family protein [Cellulomonas flavigena]ADG75748.1 Hly-III family protein [Cellulomonas flavigena DSM 20109]
MDPTSARTTPTPGTAPPARLSRDGSVHVTDERINTITHLAASCFALVGGGLLVTQAATEGDVWKIVGLGVYAASVLLLFVASTLHHGIDKGPRVNGVLRTLDYASVFVLIAGTTTPMVLVLFRDAYGWAVLGAVWVVAAVGIALRSALRELPKYVTNTLYITMGWMPVLLVGAGVTLPVGAYVLLATGGLVYCVGFVVFVIERPNPLPGVLGFHEIWHVLVVLAAALHYLLMYRYVLPA